MYIDIGWLIQVVEIIALLFIALGIFWLATIKKHEHERERRLHASSYIKAWNSPELLEGNRMVLLSGRDWRGLQYDQFTKLTEEDHETYYRVIILLNFFEELAQSIEFSLSDEESLQKYFLSTAESTFETFEPFITYLRERSKSNYLFLSFEKLVYRWRHNPPLEKD